MAWLSPTRVATLTTSRSGRVRFGRHAFRGSRSPRVSESMTVTGTFAAHVGGAATGRCS
nr:MAG TPA: hypothetical protein [Caudoviricetes sp.]